MGSRAQGALPEVEERVRKSGVGRPAASMVMHEWLSCAATSNALKLNQGSSLPFCLIVSAPKKGA